MPGSALTRPQAAPPRGLPSSRSPAFDFSRAGPRLPASVGKAWEWAWRLGLRSPSLDTAGGFAGLCLALPLSDTVAPLTWGHGGESQFRAQHSTPACCCARPPRKRIQSLQRVAEHVLRGQGRPFPFGGQIEAAFRSRKPGALQVPVIIIPASILLAPPGPGTGTDPPCTAFPLTFRMTLE